MALRRRPDEHAPQKAPTKQRVSLRLSRDVVNTFRVTSDGWLTRIAGVLRELLARHH